MKIQTAFGLHGKCFVELMRVLEAYKDYRAKEDKPSLNAFTKYCRVFEQHWFGLNNACDRVLATDWPGTTRQQIVDRYRNSDGLGELTPNLYGRIEDTLTDDEKQQWIETNYHADFDHRFGSPHGPEDCSAKEHLLEELEALVTESVLMGADITDTELAMDVGDDDDSETMGLSTIIDELKQRTHQSLPFSREFVAYHLGRLRDRVLLSQDKASRREVVITIPLDCPDDLRDTTVARIVARAKQERSDCGYNYDARDRISPQRRLLRQMPAAFADLAKSDNELTRKHQRQSRHTVTVDTSTKSSPAADELHLAALREVARNDTKMRGITDADIVRISANTVQTMTAMLSEHDADRTRGNTTYSEPVAEDAGGFFAE